MFEESVTPTGSFAACVPASVGPTSVSVRAELEKILASSTFVRSQRISRFLRYTVEQTLAGQGDSLKEYLIATEVYDKPETMDPRFDPIVRVEAGRLRSKLREYYETDGREDEVIISFRKRSYAPAFMFRHEDSEMPRSLQADYLVQGVSSIAVLPFADMSRRHDQEYFCDGLTEEVINVLAQHQGLRVVARTSVFQYKGQANDIRKIGSQLGVSAVLEGSIRKYGNRMRVTAQLNGANDGFHVWSETYDRDMKDMFALQDELSRTIASRVLVSNTSTVRPN